MSDNQVIPGAAVEAAAKAAFALGDRSDKWCDIPDRLRKRYQEEVTLVLEAAAPYMLAEFDRQRKYDALASIRELGSDDPSENPYRSQE